MSDDTKTLPPPVMTSTTAQQLLDEDITPTNVDVQAMFVQLQAMQKRLDELNKANQLVNAGTVETALNDLWVHVKARAAASPSYDFTGILTVIEDTRTNLDKGIDVADKDVELIRTHLEDMAPHSLRLELEYLAHLGRDLKKAVLAK